MVQSNDKKTRRGRLCTKVGVRQRDMRTKSGIESVTAILPANLLVPSNRAFKRLHSIPLLFESLSKLPLKTGGLGFDSWAGIAVGLRDIDSGHIRRLRFDAGPIVLELVAEKQIDGWDFVGRIYSRDSVAYEFVLEAGRKRLLPHSDGFYHWNSKSVLRKLSIVTTEQRIDFGGITW